MRLDNFLFEGRDEDPYDVVSELYSKSLPYIMEYIKAFRPVSLKSQMLLSGRSYDQAIFTSAIRTDRSPKDTPWDTHVFVDELFYKYFHVHARSASIFVTGRLSTASSYGNKVYGIFPNGTDYKIIWSPDVSDLFSDALEHDFSLIGKDTDIIDDWDLDRFTRDAEDDASNQLRDEFENDNSPDDFEDEDGYIKARDEYIDSRLESLIDSIARKKFEEVIEDQEEEVARIIRNYKEGDLKNAILSQNEVMLSGRSYTGVRNDYLPYVLRYMEVHGAKKPTPHLFASAMVGIDLNKFFYRQNLRFKEISGRLQKSLNSININDPKR